MATHNPFVTVVCEYCGEDFEVPNNVAWHTKACPKCKYQARKKWETERDEENRQKRLDSIRAREWNIGGVYHVCKDPDQSFGVDSSFTFNEINQMLKRGYLVPGTEFRMEPSRVPTHRVVRVEDGIRLINILKPNVIIGQKGKLQPVPVYSE